MLESLSFRQKIFFTLVVLIGVMLILVTSISFVATRDNIVDRASAQLGAIADLKIVQIEKWLIDGRKSAQLVPTLSTIRERLPLLLSVENSETVSSTRTEIMKELGILAEAFSSVWAISLLHPTTGLVMVSSDPSLEGRTRKNDGYIESSRSEITVSSVRYSLGREASVLIVSGPVRDEYNNLVAIVTAEMNTSMLKEIFDDRSQLGRTGYAYLIDSHGLYVTTPGYINEKSIRNIIGSKGISRSLAGDNGIDRYHDPRGLQVLGAYRWLQGENLGLLVEVEMTEITEQIANSWLLIVLTGLGFLILGGFAAHQVSAYLVSPLSQINNAVHALQIGDLQQRVPVNSNDELGRLAQNFNAMAEELEKSRDGLEAQVEQRSGELLSSEHRYKTLIETMNDGVGVQDKDGQITYVNKRFADMVGYDRNELLGMKVIDLVVEDKREELVRQIRHRKKGSVESYELAFVQKSGGVIYVWMSPQPIFDEEGNYSGSFAVMTDITERKQTEQLLLEASELNDNIINESPIGLAIYDGNGQCIAANASVAKMIGATREQMLQQNYRQLDSWKKSGLLDAANESIRLQEKRRHEFDVLSTFGNRAFFDCLFVPFMQRGGQRLLIMLDDITERRQIEAELDKHRHQLEELVDERTSELRSAQDELLRKNRLATLGQLTATVSHEIRNPLGAMRPALYLMKKALGENANEKFLQAYELIDRNIDRCDHIIDELLDFTRLTDQEKQSTDIDLWLDSIIEEQSIPQDIQVEKNYSLGRVSLPIDVDRLRRAVINVVENGCQAMQDASGKVRQGSQLSITTGERDDRIEITISDTGIGIPEDIKEKIFEPLFSTKSFGVGLGMPTVKQIMEQHEGGIEISSKEGKGTIVTLWLPDNVSRNEVLSN